MQLGEIFEKRVDRQIEGVIKADDSASLRTEIEEYVLTQEVEKRLEAFFDAYNNYQGANGVWISGFFGFGKSHLLKMLAYLLESGSTGDDFIVDTFLEKTKDNKILSAEIEKAVRTPSKSILFNIDQKADVISKEDFDALLSVFVKVFDEMQGYYGKQGHIAQFERDLDNRGIYRDFIAEYERISGQTWEKGREEVFLEEHNISLAYASVAEVPQETAQGILGKYRSTYKVSIEDFAEMVHDYIQRQADDFRLNFFVDEVGQYIANNVKLMTNLQTIAESLATKCRGRAWIIVTAQEDMNTVVGEMGKQQSNDFSKIQDRFRNRMKLTSADVAEVIQKRLLAKNGEGVRQLAHVYGTEVNNFKTLFDFADGSQRYRNFRDEEHFIGSYPFIPYQFVLFQSAIQSLSQHNAFEGKHSSVGERSMLAVFQQVAIQIGNHSVGQLATFDLMFEGIRNSLKTSVQQSILSAERTFGQDAFEVSILKALFLIKYVKEFHATEHNISVLMTPHFDQDIGALRKKVQEALNILEKDTYIQRNGEIYEYLTDEEKDIEQEIKNTEIETAKVVDELGKVIFDSIIRETKIRSEETGYDYAFTRKIDDEAFRSKHHELAINVITPFHEYAGNREVLISRRMGEDELLILLPVDDRLVRDLQLYVQTHKYFQQNYNTAQTEQVKMILTNKQGQNNQRLEAIRERTRELMRDSDYIVNGTELDLNGSDPQTKVFKGFHQLIRSTYTNLKMLGDRTYRDTDIPQYINPNNDMFGEIEMSEAEHEIQTFILREDRSAKRVTLSRLIETFERKPYGWYRATILCNLAKLSARAKVEVRQDSNALEGNRLADALMNSRTYQNLILAPEEDYSPQQIRDLKQFYADFFDKPAGAEEGKALAQLTRESIEVEARDMAEFVKNIREFPFLEALNPVIDKMKSVSGKPAAFYLTDFLKDDADVLLDMKEDTIAPVLTFMNGEQRRIYSEASEFLKTQDANFQAVGHDLAIQIRDVLEDPTCYRGDRMRQVNNMVTELQGLIQDGLKDAKTRAKANIEDMQARLTGDDKFNQLDSMQKNNVLEAFKDVTAQIEATDWIERVNGLLRTFEQRTFTDLLVQIDEWLAPEPELEDMDDETVVVKPTYVRKGDIRVRFDKLALEDEADVEAYLQRLKDAYLKEIRDGKRIQL